MTHYNTIEQEGFAEYKERGSRFLAYSFPFDDAQKLKGIIQKFKNEHPKAVHFCFAYKIGIDGNKFRSTDDGEPSGSAGKPILGQIESKELTDVLLVVVRYFGGSLLGVSGLINAYKSAAAMALQVIPIVRKPIMIKATLEFDYTMQKEISIIIKRSGCILLSQENTLFSIYKIAIPIDKKDEVLHRFKEMRHVEIS